MAPVPDIGTVSHSVSSTPTQPDLPSSSSDSPDSTYYHPSGLTMFFVIELPLIVILIFSILVAVLVRRCSLLVPYQVLISNIDSNGTNGSGDMTAVPLSSQGHSDESKDILGRIKTPPPVYRAKRYRDG
ncbi:uncharacterized protein RSE6_05189 [Rhynchosporium secalis]|uniref:Uncharacterized protein n=1 Tax=Rhynchosporium secalis TaxID=38038 RepID=A0A1E1M755_RHYSE|nr:uncharacterized protein RSE6_05189 [Rhynchosporium secalis]